MSMPFAGVPAPMSRQERVRLGLDVCTLLVAILGFGVTICTVRDAATTFRSGL